MAAMRVRLGQRVRLHNYLAVHLRLADGAAHLSLCILGGALFSR